MFFLQNDLTPPTLSPQPKICKEYLDPHIDKYICDADMGILKKSHK